MLDRAFVFTNCCLLIGLCLGSLALANQTSADNPDGLYIGFALAPQLFPDNEAGNVTVEFDTGIAFSALIGYKLSNLRFESEFAYQTVEGTSTTNVNADIEIGRFTGAAYYDFNLFALKPYLGGGLGVATLETSGDFENKDTGFTWHGEAGLTFNLTDQVAILPSYRYEWTDTDIGGFNKGLTAHAFRIALRYQFQPASRRVREADDDYRYKQKPSYQDYPRYEPDPYYKPYYHHRPHPKKHRPHPKKHRPTKTPEQRERDRCGWQGPGCPPNK